MIEIYVRFLLGYEELVVNNLYFIVFKFVGNFREYLV